MCSSIPIQGLARLWNYRSLQPDSGICLQRPEAAAALIGLIGCVGDRQFGQRGIEQLNRMLPLCWWTAYSLYDDGAPPKLHVGGSFGAEDCIQDAFAAYRGGLFKQDETFQGVRAQVAAGEPMMSHLHALELTRPHRNRIYRPYNMAERLSFSCRDGERGLLAVNLYRHEAQRPFSDDERDDLQQIGAFLLACVSRQIALGSPRPAESGADPATAPSAAVLAPLTRREREVCERLLRGWTHDGIAADLALSATTVKTYRDRAFDRLGIHHRNELFALVMDEQAALGR